MKNRQIPMTDEQWEVKAEAIRRKLNLNSKSAAVRKATDKLYTDLNLAPLNSNAEEMEQ